MIERTQVKIAYAYSFGKLHKLTECTSNDIIDGMMS